MASDSDELHRLQNCSDSTKSTYRLPLVTKEETKKWLEKLRSEEGKYCFVCSKGKKLLGYLQFKADRLPFPCLRFEEILIDEKQEAGKTAELLVAAIKSFKERYGYRRIFAYVPEISMTVTEALEKEGFKKTGAMKGNYLIRGHYVNVALYALS